MALDTNLLAYWKFDESSGNAADATGNGYTAVNTSVTYSAGKINNGANFSGNGSMYYAVGDSTTFNFQPTDAFSVSYWIKFDSFPPLTAVLSTIQNSGNYPGWEVGGGRETVWYTNITRIDGSSKLVVYCNPGFSTGTWYHVVHTYSGSSTASGVKTYVNAVSKSMTVVNNSLSGTIGYTVGPNIGRRSGVSRYGVDGMLDEMGVWDRELSATEVSALYNAGNGLAYPFSTAVGNPGAFFQMF